LDARTHYTFEVILPTGKPKLPKKVADTFKKQCGVLVRDHVSINVESGTSAKGRMIVSMSPKGIKRVLE
jgi:hypothetical protein